MTSADALRQDLTLAWRSLRASPGYALLVVVTLAAGIAAATTIVSVMNPYLIRAVPYDEPERLVQLGLVDPVSGWDAARFSLDQAEDVRERSRALEALASYYYTNKNLTGDGEAESVVAAVLSPDLLELLGVEAALGRVFVGDDGGPGGRDVVLLSDGLWRRRFGADPGVLGRTVELDGVPHSVVGVVAPDFRFPFGGVKLWVPLRDDASTEERDEQRHILVARLGPEWTRETAVEELEAIQRELSTSYPDADGRFSGVTVKPLGEALNFGYDIMKVSFLVLLGAVVFVLLIACVNVASLTLARVSGRTRDVAVRTALGAGRRRVVRQLLTESVVLALGGGLLGVALAGAAARAIGRIIPEELYRVGEVEVDGLVLGFSMAITLVTPLVFGLAPALVASRTDLTSALKAGGPGAGTDAASSWARRGLVVLEVAMAIVLVTGTGLMLRSLLALQEADLGFSEEGVLTAGIALPLSDYPGEVEQALFFERALEELEALPSVRAAGAVVPLPMNHSIWGLQFAPPGAPADTSEWPNAHEFRVSPGYFDAMGVSLLAGRVFDVTDEAQSPPTIVVSEAVAERYWPGAGPVGETIRLLEDEGSVTASVIGVVTDVRHEGFEDDGPLQIYRPFSQAGTRRRFLVLDVEGDPLAASGAVREALAAIDPNLPAVYRPMSDIVAENALQWSFSAMLLGAFGLVALALASLGVYGIVAYTVALRRREIATRMALGASSRDVRRAVLGEGLRLTALGGGLGILLAGGAAKLAASVLYGVSPFDPATFLAVVALFAATAIAASLAPARSASRVEPWRVLRSE